MLSYLFIVTDVILVRSPTHAQSVTNHSAAQVLSNSTWSDTVVSRIWIILGRKGTLGCLLHLSRKFHNSVFLFVGLTTLKTVIEYWLVGSLVEYPNVSGVILCIIIRDVVQFIRHCLIPVDPCHVQSIPRIIYKFITNFSRRFS